MQKRRVIVALAMCLAVLVPYGVVQMTAATPALDDPGVSTPAAPLADASARATGAAPVLLPATRQLVMTLAAVPETTMLFATGVALLGLAAGVRRRY